MTDMLAAGRTTATPMPSPVRRSRFHLAGRRPKFVVVAADAVAISVASSLGLWAMTGKPGVTLGAAEVAFGVLALPIWLTCFARQHLYLTRMIDRRADEARRVLHASATASVWLAVLAWWSGVAAPRRWVLVTFLATVLLVLAERQVLRAVFRRRRRAGRALRRVLVAGASGEGEQLCAMLDAEPEHGYRVVGFLDDDLAPGTLVRDRPVVAGAASAVDAVEETGADSVLIASSVVGPFAANHLARALCREGVHVELTSTLQDIAVDRLTMRNLGGRPVVYLEPLPRGWRLRAKRVFDVVLAGGALFAISPVCAAIALLIKLDSRGPVIFRQLRVGRDGVPFHVWKFRTMVEDAESLLIDLREHNEADGPLFKLRQDPRVTRVGRFLRRTSIDELPQLWNVLRGEMSLVGPRPALPDESELWDVQLRERLRVRPGITGMWQVSGRSNASFEQYSRLDLYYVDNWSPVLDLGILLRTIPTVLLSKGAY